MMRWLAIIFAVLLAAGGIGLYAIYSAAGRTPPATLHIDKPEKIVGQQGTLEISAAGTHGRLWNLTAVVEQNGHTVPLLSIDAAAAKTLWTPDTDRVSVVRKFGKESVPELKEGAARIVVTATTTSWMNLRTFSSQASKDIQVRLEPPRIAVLSTHHYVNHGGAEMVVYRATPADIDSGVRVGDVEYPGFPASGAGATTTDPAITRDPSIKVAFFALLYDQPLNTPITAFARDAGGTEATASFMDNVFEKPQKHSRIEIDDKFVNRVVPEILEHSPELKITPPAGDQVDQVAKFVKINSELRKMNSDDIVSITEDSSPTRLWSGPFEQLGNSKVEAAFADHRTYVYKGKEIDQQVHLGFDLAVTANVPVLAANAGKVVNARWLGIFGNCVIIDHGMGVASLYGHLSSFDVKVGESVARGQTIGKSGMTGLAAGDHLHFTMLVAGHPVNPVEWWDSHWVQDRGDRTLKELGEPGGTEPQKAPPAAPKAPPHAKPAGSSAARRGKR
jgi:murein DD-endopeptidase MepM/ murein hydrolase activator NlpD